ncbi:MAG: UDP-3-O-(3-hydroxymyristoyl)glucosamine N-acyltransferase [Paludibacteraceae bacterium]|nr:UDP-3-O-(3-hydroxymyristoyl)glucosamine N-acyltransferase [Paludibacteraceae bacterium]
MEISAQELAKMLGGVVEGDATVKVFGYAKIEEGKSGMLSFLSNPKYEHYLYNTQSSIVLVNNDLKLTAQPQATLIRVPDAYLALAQLLQYAEAQNKTVKKGIDPTAVISKTAKIGKNCYIGPFVYIGDEVEIGDNTQVYSHVAVNEKTKIGTDCILYNGVVIYHGCVIGNRCILHANSVIGSDGFGFAKQDDGSYFKMPQNGNVILEDDVEIGATTTIDRGSMGPTILHKGVKLDNQVQIAHNVEVGENSAMAGCSGVAGSTKIGKNCIVGGLSGIIGHLHIDDNTTIAAYTGITNSTREPGQIFQGIPAQPINKARRSFAVYRNLPELSRTVYELEKELKALKAQLDSQNG